MADVWDKLDRYTKSDYLNSSDDENQEVYFQQTEHLYISTKKFYQTEVDDESLCSEDVDTLEDSTQDQQEIQENKEKLEIKGNTYDSLLDEMKKSELHCNSETRNVQEKIDKMSSEKSQPKDELNEMQHKAQVISKSARMSATDVLSAITSSETMDHEESGELDEYYEKIRSTNTEKNTPKDSPESERKSSSGASSDVDLPSIAPLSVSLNTGVMKSKANVARQGSMKARRKPTVVKRKSWTPGMDEYDLREQDEETVEDVEQNEQGDTWVTTQARNEDDQTGSCSSSDSSSEDEKEVVKPHMRSAIAMPGLGDALKIQLTRSELKRPTAMSLAKTAKDAKVNEITKEDKVETQPSKPDWMAEVEKRKKQPRVIPQRRHKTLPERSSELDTLFEQRKRGQSSEVFDPRGQQNASEASRPKSFPGEDLDPELQNMFERRKNLTPLEGEGGTVKDVERPKSFHEDKIDPELSRMFEKRKNLASLIGEGETERPKSFHEDKIDPELSRMFEKRKNLSPLAGEGEVERPKSFHGGKIDSELSRMFEKRKNLTPFEVADDGSDEATVAKERQRPKSYHGDELDSELNKMFLRRKNLRPVEGTAGDRDEEDQVFKPRNVHLQNSQATELDKIFEKRKQLRPVGEARSHTPLSATGEFSTSVANSSPELRQTSGIVRARFHDTKLEPLPSRGEILKVATVSAGEVRTARQVSGRRRMSPEEREGGRGLPTSGERGSSKPPRTPTNEAQVAEFTFDGRGAAQATVKRIPVGESGPSKPPRTPTGGALVAEFAFDGRGATQATVGRIPVQSVPLKPHRTMSPHGPTTPERGRSSGEQTAEFVSDGVGGMLPIVEQVSGSGGNRRGILNPIGRRQLTSPEEENSGQEASGAQVTQFAFDGSAAASRATVARIPVGGGQEYVSPSKGDSPGDDVARGDHVMSARAHVIESRDGITKKMVVSPKSSKSDTRDFIEQLSRKQAPEKSSSRGKFISKSGPLDNKPERDPPLLSSARGRRELYTDKEHPTHNKTRHNDRRNSAGEGSIPLPQYVPLSDELPSRNLPPISSYYTTPPSQNSNLRHLPRSVSHPPHSQFPNHPPLHSKTSDPQPVHIPHSPRGPKEGRPRPVRIREVKDPVREVDPEPYRVCYERPPPPNTSRDINGYVGLGNGESYGDGNRFSESVASRPNERHDAKVDQVLRTGRSPKISDHKGIQGTRNPERLGDEIGYKGLSSDWSTDQRFDGRADVQKMNRVLSQDRSTGQRMSRDLSPDRSTGQRMSRDLSPDRSTGPRMNRVLSPDRSTGQRMSRALSPDRSTGHRMNRVLSPDRSTGQRMSRDLSPDRSTGQRMSRDLSPDRSTGPRMNRVLSPDRSTGQRMSRDLSPDRFTGPRMNRVLSPDRSTGQRMSRALSPDGSTGHRMNRVLSPDRSTGQRMSRALSPDRSTGHTMNRVLSPDRSTGERTNRGRSPDRSTDQRKNRVLSPDRSRGPRMNRALSPVRSTGHRMNRVQSRDGSDDEEMNNVRYSSENQMRSGSGRRSEDQMIVRRDNPERSSDDNKIKNRNSSGGERTRDHHDLEQRVKSSNGVKRSYQNSIENENLDIRNSGNGRERMTSNELTSSQSRNTDSEKRSGGVRVSSSAGQGNALNRDNVERPQPVSATVTSLSESHVNARMPVVRSHDKDGAVYGECVVNNGMVNGGVGRKGVRIAERPSLDAQSSEVPAIPKWKQELQAKKRLQRERQEETLTKQNKSIKPEQSGNDMAEWQKRLQGIRKTWGSEESRDPEMTSQGDHLSQSDIDEHSNVPGLLKNYQQKKNKEITKDDVQDTETFV